MTSEQARRRLASWRALRDQRAPGRRDVVALRAEDELIPTLATEPDHVRFTPAVGAPVWAEWAEPVDSVPGRVIQYHHGGGFVFGSIASHRRLVGHLARSARCRVLSVEYRLAPEHPFPAALDDMSAVHRWLINREPLTCVYFAGDSAGAGLTLSALVRIRDEGGWPPDGAILFSPLTDLTFTGASVVRNAAADVLLDLELAQWTAALYANGIPVADPRLSPVYAPLNDLPPVLIQVGTDELLLDDSVRVAEQIKAAGGSATLQRFDDMQHVFQLSAGYLPEADDALARVAAFLREQDRARV